MEKRKLTEKQFDKLIDDVAIKAINMLGSAIVQTINTCVAIEDRQELAKDVCDGILELIINQVN